MPVAGPGEAVLFGIDWLIEGKFYSIFSILLGVGFVLQRKRAVTRGEHGFDRFFRRRMLVLVAIGLVHMIGLWYGDILLLYGLMGLALPTLARLTSRAQLRLAVALLAFPVFTHAVILASSGALDPRVPFARAAAQFGQTVGIDDRSSLDLFTSEEPRDVWLMNLAGAMVRPGTYLQAGRPAKVLGLFLLGAWLAVNVLPRLPESRRQLRLTILAGGALGLIANIVYAQIKAETGSTFLLSRTGMLQTVAYHSGTTPLALAYMSGLALVWLSPRQRIIAWFAPLGRMALSVYLLQSILQLAIFSGYGLGLAGRVPFVMLPLLAVVIIAAQQRWCSWWLRRYAHGPMEWVWRRLTYVNSS